MNLALWIVAGFLALVLLAGSLKIVLSRERIAAAGRGAQWVHGFSPAALRAIGVVELLAAAGLILPAVTGIAPILVPITATGVSVLFVLAATTRLRHGERVTVLPDLTYLCLAVFLTWGRFVAVPF